ncbi:MAG: hypothetical protein QM723_34665 [Myxococcaceae bacterium]
MADNAGAPGLQFRLGSIPVLIRWSFFIFPALGFMTQSTRQAVAWAVVLLVSVLLHELGHALMMRRYGFAPRIELYALGGFTYWPPNARPTTRQQLLVSLSGPGMQVLLAGAALGVWYAVGLGAEWDWLWRIIARVNLIWAGINMLPMLPWDGGNALESAVTLKFGARPKVVGAISIACGVAVIVTALLWGQNMMLGYVGIMGIQQGWVRWSYKAPTLEELLAAAAKNTLPLNVWPPLIRALMSNGRPDVVRDLFGRRIAAGQAITAADAQVAQAIVATLFAEKHYAECADLCTRFFNETGHAEQAVNAASAFTRLGDLDGAMAWLEKAIAAGFTDRASLAADEDLAPLRERPDFQVLLQLKT